MCRGRFKIDLIFENSRTYKSSESSFNRIIAFKLGTEIVWKMSRKLDQTPKIFLKKYYFKFINDPKHVNPLRTQNMGKLTLEGVTGKKENIFVIKWKCDDTSHIWEFSAHKKLGVVV